MTASTNDGGQTVPITPTTGQESTSATGGARARRRPLTTDPEVSALAEIGEIMNGLKDAEQARVMAWLNAKYGPMSTAGV